MSRTRRTFPQHPPNIRHVLMKLFRSFSLRIAQGRFQWKIATTEMKREKVFGIIKIAANWSCAPPRALFLASRYCGGWWRRRHKTISHPHQQTLMCDSICYCALRIVEGQYKHFFAFSFFTSCELFSCFSNFKMDLSMAKLSHEILMSNFEFLGLTAKALQKAPSVSKKWVKWLRKRLKVEWK